MIKKNVLLCLIFLVSFTCAIAGDREKLEKLEKRIISYKINKTCKDDSYGLIVVKSALVSLKEGSGGIGACLVDITTKEVVEYGRNRQHTPYFRSDLHAEMDLLNRYENRMKKTRSLKKGRNLRKCDNLVLVTSMEPCPMCLTRIINSGIKTVLYVVEDKQGGMVTRIDSLPPFWRKFAADREFRKADCSPQLWQIAHDLFHFSNRNFVKNRKK